MSESATKCKWMIAQNIVAIFTWASTPHKAIHEYVHYFLKVVILHHMLSKATVKARPTVLWCYKKELGFSRYVSL